MRLLIFCLLCNCVIGQSNKTYYDFKKVNIIQPLCSIDSNALHKNIKLLTEFSKENEIYITYNYYKDIGVCYHRLFDITNNAKYLDKCIEAFEKVISIKPNDAQTLWNLGIIFTYSKNDCVSGVKYLRTYNKRLVKKKYAKKNKVLRIIKECDKTATNSGFALCGQFASLANLSYI
jgi:tetratricopeptide (TPR) repeat protein